ncbi:MAG: FAD-binding oxidoreductase [Taibaiella sp.]|nr:FAD-binding oxidoreductase [Taibaiella sp.]
MISYWEQKSFTLYDHIIIGAGIVGLSAAIELTQHFPGQRILVLERGMLPTGASTRNAGFACMGSATELLDDLGTSTEAEVVGLFAARKRGLELLRKRLGDERIGYEAKGSYELIRRADESVLERLDYLNELLFPVLNTTAFSHAHGMLGEFGFNPAFVSTLVENNCEGALHSGKMMRALIDLAMQLGAEIKTGAQVNRFSESGSSVEVLLEDAFRGQILLKCKTLSICTNAFTDELLPGEDVVPGRGQIIVTSPIPGLKLKGIYHLDRGYYYFREIDGRVLIGGGRNLDFVGEQTTAMDVTELIQADLEAKLKEVVLPGQPFEIEYRWAGIMAFGNSKRPIVRSFSNRVFGAFRMGGMGVALGTEVAAEMAGLVALRWPN